MVGPAKEIAVKRMPIIVERSFLFACIAVSLLFVYNDAKVVKYVCNDKNYRTFVANKKENLSKRL